MIASTQIECKHGDKIMVITIPNVDNYTTKVMEIWDKESYVETVRGILEIQRRYPHILGCYASYGREKEY